MKRQLDENEKKWVNITLVGIKEELEYTEQAEKPRVELTISVAPLEYKKQLDVLKKNKKLVDSKIEEFKETIKSLEDQLKNGVEIIETDNTDIEEAKVEE